MCRVASHMNLERKEEADRRAKEVAMCVKQEDCMHIPYTDYYRYIKIRIKKSWQY